MRQLIRVQVPAWAPSRIDRRPPMTAVVLRPALGTPGVGSARAVSSVGQSPSLTPRKSLVRVQYRPPHLTLRTALPSDRTGASMGLGNGLSTTPRRPATGRRY